MVIAGFTLFCAVNVCLQIMKRVHKAKSDAGRRTRDALSVSGPEFYGFSSDVCSQYIEGLPGAMDCVGYVFRDQRPVKGGIASGIVSGRATPADVSSKKRHRAGDSEGESEGDDPVDDSGGESDYDAPAVSTHANSLIEFCCDELLACLQAAKRANIDPSSTVTVTVPAVPTVDAALRSAVAQACKEMADSVSLKAVRQRAEVLLGRSLADQRDVIRDRVNESLAGSGDGVKPQASPAPVPVPVPVTSPAAAKPASVAPQVVTSSGRVSLRPTVTTASGGEMISLW